MHPKVKAGANAAGLVTALAAVLAVAGVQLDSELQQALVMVLSAVIPVIAGYVKTA